jgi:hypothetical protein
MYSGSAPVTGVTTRTSSSRIELGSTSQFIAVIGSPSGWTDTVPGPVTVSPRRASPSGRSSPT